MKRKEKVCFFKRHCGTMGWTCTVRSKESEKIDKYQDLALERQTCAHCHRSMSNLVPRAFSSFKMAVGETPGQGCQSGSKNSLEFR